MRDDDRGTGAAEPDHAELSRPAELHHRESHDDMTTDRPPPADDGDHGGDEHGDEDGRDDGTPPGEDEHHGLPREAPPV